MGDGKKETPSQCMHNTAIEYILGTWASGLG